MKKAICFMLCVIMCFSLVCCKSADDNTVSKPQSVRETKLKTEEISLLYYSGDSLNPYTAKTEHNREIAHLLYDPLIKYDNNFKPVYCLAKSAKLKDKTCTVKLNTAYFTDKTPVTASDVVYSYNLAVKSDTVYGKALYEVSGISASGNTVTFDLKNVDPYFLNLIDFPIIKSGSDNSKNSDGIEIAPVGSGRYYPDEDGNALIRNNDYYGAKGEVAKINLINTPDEISASHYVEVGATDIYYADESVQNIARMSGKRADVNTNNFVYVGINSSYGQLSSNNVRYALSAAIDRTEICHSAYFDNAKPASGFFNPDLTDTSAVQSLKTIADTQITVENLEEIGYNKLKDGYYCNDAGNHISFTLLVNSDNPSRVTAAKLIAAQCKAAGIEIDVIERGYEEYVSLLESRGFQLYLGEIKVLPNFDLQNLVVSGGSVAYGVGKEKKTNDKDDAGEAKREEPAEGENEEEKVKTSVCADMVNKYKNGKCSISDLAGAFLTEMPQIPVCYRNGMLFYTSKITSKAKPSASDIFLNFENYKFK